MFLYKYEKNLIQLELTARQQELPGELLNYSLRRIVKDKGAFPNDEAISELLWLACGKPRRSGSGIYATGKPAPTGSSYPTETVFP